MNTFYATAENINSTFSKIYKDAQKKTLTACINTVNIQAAKARQNAIQNLQADFTLRNKFTVGSIRYTQCPKNITNFAQIMSVIGATERADYLERQEHGGYHRSKNGTRLAIPTTAARGGTPQRQVQKKYRLNQLQRLDDRGISNSGRTRKSNLVARAYVADKLKLLMTYNKAIYAVSNFEKNNDKISFNKTMIYQNKFTETKTNPLPWLAPAIEQPAQDCQLIFNQQMDIIFTK